MPRNGSGVYSKPAGTTAVANTVIESSKYNQTIDDLVDDNNAARPVVAGGTGATSAASARTNLGVDPARTFVTKSAGYTALAADKAANIRFDGAYTLSLTAAATLGSGWYCYVQADGGAVTIDPNASETINGATTLVIPDGYSTLVWCDGSNFRALEDFLRIDNWVDIASATTTDIGAAASQNVRVTGTTTITGLGTVAAGTFRRVRFAGALTLTYNATSLILPGAANITTVAGDVAEFISEGSGNWRCVNYQYAEGPSGFRRIATIDITSSTASQDVAIPSWARQIRITGYAIPVTSGASILLRVAVSGVFNSTAGAYQFQFNRADSTTVDAARDTATLTGFNLLPGSNNGSNGGGSFDLLMTEVNQSRHTYFSNRNTYLSPGGNVADLSGSGIFISASALSDLRFLSSSGNISILHAVIEAAR